MADASLDDFFAKKDKSKKSKSRKFVAGSDQIGKSNDDGGKMSEKAKREKEKVTNSSTGSASLQTPVQDDDEWRDIEEKETDYTGLKIQNVQISDMRDEDQERIKLEELQDEEQLRQKDSLGPWNRGGVGNIEPAPPVEQTPVTAPKTEGKYVAPFRRENQATQPQVSRKSKVAPQLASEFDFPTLSAASDVKPPKKIETSDVSKGKFNSQSSENSNMRRSNVELSSRSQLTNESESS